MKPGLQTLSFYGLILSSSNLVLLLVSHIGGYSSHPFFHPNGLQERQHPARAWDGEHLVKILLPKALALQSFQASKG